MGNKQTAHEQQRKLIKKVGKEYYDIDDLNTHKIIDLSAVGSSYKDEDTGHIILNFYQ